MVAEACTFEFEHEDFKMRRAAQRNRRTKLNKKRPDVEPDSAPPVRRGSERRGQNTERHGAVRAAARTCLAKKAMETDADMPSLSGGSRAAKTTPPHGRKQSVSHLLKPRPSPILKWRAADLAEQDTCDEYSLDAVETESSVSDDVEVGEDEADAKANDIKARAEAELHALKQRAAAQCQAEKPQERFAAEAAAALSARAAAALSAAEAPVRQLESQEWEMLPENSPKLKAEPNPEGLGDDWDLIL